MKIFLALLTIAVFLSAPAWSHDQNEGPYAPSAQDSFPEFKRDWLHPTFVEDAFQERSITEFGLEEGELALTIDDGPSENSLRVLELLDKYKIHVTFFLIGKNALAHPDIVEKEAKAGHAIGNHTYNHLTNYDTSEQLIEEVLATHNVILPFIQKYGTKRFYFRSPGGNWNSWRYRYLSEHTVLSQYLGPIYWNVGGDLIRGANGEIVASADWACWRDHVSPEDCAQGYYNEILTRKKGVILMHDLTPQSAEMLGHLLQKLSEGGRDGRGNGTWKFRYFDEMDYMNRYL